jgi:RNA polymerase-binding transcription factor DksA
MEIEQAVDEAPGGPVDVAPEEAIDVVDLLLDQVEAALGRLDDGTYGTCTTCTGAIEDHLLAETPTAQECAACASDARTGPVEPQPVVEAPEGVTGTVIRDVVGAVAEAGPSTEE